MATLQNLIAIIVTWNPERDLERNVNELLPQVDELYIVDNGSTVNLDLVDGLGARQKVSVIRNSANLGVATALNQGMAMARQKGATWALLLDQDSSVTPGYTKAAELALQAHADSGKIAIITPVIRDRLSDVMHARSDSNQKDDAFVDSAITSGSLFNVEHALQLGPFLDELFSDYVDHEYCLRARAHGYTILEVTDAILEHAIGRPTSHSLLWSSCRTTNHNASRRYYVARNRLWLYKMYIGLFPGWVARDAYAFVKEIVKVALFERHAIEKLRSIARGILDGVSTRPAKTYIPLKQSTG